MGEPRLTNWPASTCSVRTTPSNGACNSVRAQVQFGACERRPGFIERGFGHAGGAHPRFHVGAADQPALLHFLEPLKFEQGEFALRPGAVQRGARLVQRDAVIPVVDAQQRLVGLEVAAGHEVGGRPHHLAGHLRHQVGHGSRRNGALGLDHHVHRAGMHFDHAHERGGGLHLGRLHGRARHHQRDRARDGCGDHRQRRDEFSLEQRATQL